MVPASPFSSLFLRADQSVISWRAIDGGGTGAATVHPTTVPQLHAAARRRYKSHRNAVVSSYLARASFLGEQSTAEVLEPQPYTPPRFLSCMRPQGDGTSPTEMQSYRRIRPISRDARSSWFLYTVAGLVTKAACTSETPKEIGR